MSRFAIGALCVVVLSARAEAQAPATAPASATIPATPAGSALRAWVDAFNSGDSTTLAAYTRRYESALDAGESFTFLQQPGRGFDVVAVARSEPRHLEYALRDRRNGMVGYGAIDVAADEPLRVTSRTLMPLGPDVSIDALRLDARGRAAVVARASALLDSFYVFPDVARRMGDSARARLARGAYDTYDIGPSFALRLDHDFGLLAHDKHLHVRYSGRPLPAPRPEGGPPPVPTPEDVARRRQFADDDNCGFRRAEVLEGNIGYVRLDGFAPTDICAPTAAAAMTFVAGSRALVIDLRENGGGSPGMVQLVASYLFDTRTHINDLWTRSTGKTEEYWTLDSLAGRRYGARKPVYVLTSSGTFSGGEEFAYDLKSAGRATLVGETTGGGAHPVRMRPIDDHFLIGVPFARAINPVTHTNWEGVGVAPDVKVKAADALATALKLIGERKQP